MMKCQEGGLLGIDAQDDRTAVTARSPVGACQRFVFFPAYRRTPVSPSSRLDKNLDVVYEADHPTPP